MAKISRIIEQLGEWQFDTWLKTRAERKERLEQIKNNPDAWNSTCKIINRYKRRD